MKKIRVAKRDEQIYAVAAFSDQPLFVALIHGGFEYVRPRWWTKKKSDYDRLVAVQKGRQQTPEQDC